MRDQDMDRSPASSRARGIINLAAAICHQDQGSFGGKAHGLAAIHDKLQKAFGNGKHPDVEIFIPEMSIICTDVFDQFMEQNDLYEIAYSEAPDDRIGLAFQQADLPFNILGQLRGLIDRTKTPLAVRSSSLLEDRVKEPFAGVYATKIIPNNQFDPQVRFRRLIEAVKYVYASLFFRGAKEYMKITGHSVQDEKMAVIIQKVHGRRHGDLFYPDISGVARSYNFYPMERARHEDGVVHLALGLGKTIVDGGISWSFSPARPHVKPPYRTVDELLKLTQTRFWAVNMGDPPEFDPLKETEYMVQKNITAAEDHGTLKYTASTYDPYGQRLTIGTASPGPRVLTFGRILELEEIPLNQILIDLMEVCESALDSPVEIEFAVTLNPHQLSFLQVRPMNVMKDIVEIEEHELENGELLLASKNVLGNGENRAVQDIIYVPPEQFESKNTQEIALQLKDWNRKLVDAGRPYLLIVLGRLGTTDPWLGIPIRWEDVSGAKAVVETTSESFQVVLSQGSHYFHNLTSLGVFYFSVPFSSPFPIDWAWLEAHPAEAQTDHLRHIRVKQPLEIKVDGRKGTGLIKKN